MTLLRQISFRWMEGAGKGRTEESVDGGCRKRSKQRNVRRESPENSGPPVPTTLQGETWERALETPHGRRRSTRKRHGKLRPHSSLEPRPRWWSTKSERFKTGCFMSRRRDTPLRNRGCPEEVVAPVVRELTSGPESLETSHFESRSPIPIPLEVYTLSEERPLRRWSGHSVGRFKVNDVDPDETCRLGLWRGERWEKGRSPNVKNPDREVDVSCSGPDRGGRDDFRCSYEPSIPVGSGNEVCGLM